MDSAGTPGATVSKLMDPQPRAIAVLPTINRLAYDSDFDMRREDGGIFTVA